MEQRLTNGLKWLEGHEKTVVWAAISGFFVVVTSLCFAKYARLGYDAIDLAYFNQVFWNTVRGRFFQQSIHPHLSLGDHAELIIPFLAPLYALWQDPRMLITMQSAALALSAWPVWLLAKDRFRNSVSRFEKTAPLLFVIIWLGGPLLQNIAFFEFHILPFALMPMLFALRAYRKDDRATFIAWMAIALLVREDVAFVVAGISLLAFMEKRSWWWRTVPLASGAAWFVGAMTLVRNFSPTGGYKFAVYYGWMGDSLPHIVRNATLHPLGMLTHLLTVPNLEMVLGMLMTFSLLPLLSLPGLILTIGPVAQILLGQSGGGALILQTHYSVLFLPGLLLASMDGYALAPGVLRRLAPLVSEKEAHLATAVLAAFCAAYSAMSLGPLPGAIIKAGAHDESGMGVAAWKMISDIPADGSVAASYALLAPLSSREHLYSAHYIFLGKTQFGESDYVVPDDLRFTLFDVRDLIAYRAQFVRTGWTKPLYDGGLAKLTAAAGAPMARYGSVISFDRQATSEQKFVPPQRLEAPVSFGGFSLLGAEAVISKGVLRASTEWQIPVPYADDVVLTLELINGDHRAVRMIKSAFNTLPSAFLDKNGARIVDIELPVSGLETGAYRPLIKLTHEENEMIIAGDRGTGLETKSVRSLGETALEQVLVQ